MADSTPPQILLVENNPGDARLIEEMLDDLESVPELADGPSQFAVRSLGSVPGGGSTLTHVDRLADGLELLSETDDAGPDVVLLDLNLPDSQGLETLQRVREAAPRIPIIVLTGLQDRQFGVSALNRGAHEYLVKGEINSDLLVRSIYHAIERAAFEAQIERQHDHLETLNELNAFVQDATEAMIGLSNREAIERTVCEELATSGLYEAACIADVDASSGALGVRTVAGAADVVDEADDGAVTLCGDASRRAIQTKEIQVARAFEGESGPAGEEWFDGAAAVGWRSAAAIPISYEQTVYGVLTVYSAREDAFDTRERTVVARLGEVVGYTINAAETKRRLHADTAVELLFESTDREQFFVDLSNRLDCGLELERVVPTTGEGLLYYATVDGAAEDVLAAAAETPSVEHVRQLSEGTDGNRFEFNLAGPTVIGTLIEHDAKVTSASAREGTVRFTAEVDPTIDVRTIVDELTADHPTVRFVGRREVDRSERETESSQDALNDALTDRQRSALYAAYHSGFFEWPRRSTGEEIAESLGITPPTYHEHLRHAEQKLMTALLDTESPRGERRDE